MANNDFLEGLRVLGKGVGSVIGPVRKSKAVQAGKKLLTKGRREFIQGLRKT